MKKEDYENCQQAVLAAVIGSSTEDTKFQAYAMSVVERFGVKPDWFRDEKHQDIFTAVQKVWREHRGLDLWLVIQSCKLDGCRDEIMALEDKFTTTANIEYYMKAFAELHIYSLAHRKMAEAMKQLEPENIGSQIESFSRDMHELCEQMAQVDGGLHQLSDYMEKSVAMKEKLHEERFVKHNWEFMDGLPWMWNSLNRCYTGIKKGLHIIGALASQGKSTLAVDLSAFWNAKGIKHGFFSLDMAADQYVDRYPCVMRQVSLSKLNFGGSAADVEKFRSGFQEAVKLNNVWISEADDAKDIEYQCYRGVKSLGWQAIIIDYIQLVTMKEGGKLPEYTRVQRVVQAVKNIAKKLEVPVVCLAQLSRGFETELRKDANAEPGLDVIGDSGEIARAASTVMVLYQDRGTVDYWKENPPAMLAYADPNDRLPYLDQSLVRNETEEQKAERRKGQLSLATSLRPVICKVLKNQQGGKMTIPLVLFPSYFMFRPGNEQAAPATIEKDGKEKKCNYPMFEQITDDWQYLPLDWILEATGAMPTRGVKLMGETYAEWDERLKKERREHAGIRQVVDGKIVVYDAKQEKENEKKEGEDGDQESADEFEI